MRYFLAIVLPPLAVLCCYRPLSTLLNLLLTLLGWIPGVIHAILIVGKFHADERARKTARTMADAIDRQTAIAEATGPAEIARRQE